MRHFFEVGTGGRIA